MRYGILIVFFVLQVVPNITFASKTFQAGAIHNREEAEVKCPAVCIANGRVWDKTWLVKGEGEIAVCNCENAVNIGPIWYDEDAEVKCRAVCTSQNVKWDGTWDSGEYGEMSECHCAQIVHF